MVGPEGLLNSIKINNLTPGGTKNPFQRNQQVNKSVVPPFSVFTASFIKLAIWLWRRA